MRFTEADLRDLLVDREHAVGEPDRVLTRVRAGVDRRGRRTVTIAAAAAVTVVALAVSLGYATWPRDRTGGGQAPPTGEPDPTGTAAAPLTARPALGFTLPDKEIAGLRVSSMEANARWQYATLTLLGPSGQSTDVFLWLFEPGAYQPRSGQPVHIAGRPGYFGSEGAPDGDRKFAAPRPSLTWQYADGAWAVLQASLDPGTARDQLSQIAARITLVRPRHARLPYRLGYLPEGLRPSAVAVTDLDTVVLTLARNGEPDLLIFARAGGPLDIPAHPWQPDATVAGHPAMARTGHLAVAVGTFNFQITALRNESEYPVAELARMATGMTLGTWTDPATWFDAP